VQPYGKPPGAGDQLRSTAPCHTSCERADQPVLCLRRRPPTERNSRAERHLFRPRARRPAGAIRGAAACRDGRRPQILRPGGQRRGDLARRAAARPPARRPPLPARVLGT
jgi:hypothetical protein